MKHQRTERRAAVFTKPEAERLERYAAKADRTVSWILRQAVEQYLTEKGE